MARTGKREKRITAKFVKYCETKQYKPVAKDERRVEWKQADVCLKKSSRLLVAEVKAGGKDIKDQSKRNNFDKGMSLITLRMTGYGNAKYALVLPEDPIYDNMAHKISRSFWRANKFTIWIVPEKGKPYVFRERRTQKGTRGQAKRRVRSSKGVSSFLTGLPHGEYSYSEPVELAHKSKVESNDKQGLPHDVASALQMQKKQGKVCSLEHGRWRILDRRMGI